MGHFIKKTHHNKETRRLFLQGAECEETQCYYYSLFTVNITDFHRENISAYACETLLCFRTALNFWLHKKKEKKDFGQKLNFLFTFSHIKLPGLKWNVTFEETHFVSLSVRMLRVSVLKHLHLLPCGLEEELNWVQQYINVQTWPDCTSGFIFAQILVFAELKS